MYIKVRVFAGAKKEALTPISADHFEVIVKEKAERNMANRKVVALIAGYYKKPLNKVHVVSGHHSPGKILSVE